MPRGTVWRLWQLIRVQYTSQVARGGALLAVGGSALFGASWSCGGVRVATFNIENYPKSSRQEAGAFEAIHEIRASAIGVQEIVQPAAFSEAARRRLGTSWRFVFAKEGPEQKVGVLFDSEVFELRSTRSYSETMTYPGAKPAFEARLAPARGAIVRMLVVHLKAAGDGADKRRVQLRALRPVVKAAAESGERLVLLGDFNATGDEDRSEIAALAEATRLTWASEGLRCTSYWSRNDGCRGQALDHALTSQRPADIAARGPCEREGCNPGKTCPVFRELVSDHCPVTIDLP